MSSVKSSEFYIKIRIYTKTLFNHVTFHSQIQFVVGQGTERKQIVRTPVELP